jgi:hypothetical protein
LKRRFLFVYQKLQAMLLKLLRLKGICTLKTGYASKQLFAFFVYVCVMFNDKGLKSFCNDY